MSDIRSFSASALLIVALAGACRTAPDAGSVSAGPDPAATPTRPAAAGGVAPAAQRRYTDGDVRFMHHMLHHHAQALVMTALVPERSMRSDLRLLAERIEVSQRDEIEQMRRWLRDRGEDVPRIDTLGPHRTEQGHGAQQHEQPHGDHHRGGAGHGDHAQMPGMATREQLDRLAGARGPEFDRLFLELMVRHHEGAITMVRELFATPGAGQDTDIFRLASDVEADQAMEIERMRRLQRTLPAGNSR